MARVIIYGDIHGCLDEWRQLRREVGVRRTDAEISVGDILSKGVKPIEALRYARKNGVKTVMGNHEERYVEAAQALRIGAEELNVPKHFYALETSDIAYLYAMPRFLRVANVTVVHAGLTNAIDLHKLAPEQYGILNRLRYITHGAKEALFWARVYDGNQGFAVYGHTPNEIRRDKHALGIDTGCVYGGKLTAAIFEFSGGKLLTDQVKIAQVAARERYF